MRLSEDAVGLAVEADLDDEDPDVQLLIRKVKRGDIDSMSFAFIATEQEWDADYRRRRILAVDLNRGDCSVVNQGANASTSVALRAARGRRPPRTLDERRAVAQALGSRVEVRGARLSFERGGMHVIRHRVVYDHRLTAKRQAQIVRAAMGSDDAPPMPMPMPMPVEVTPGWVMCPLCAGSGKATFSDRACRNCSGLGFVRGRAVPDMMTGPDTPASSSTGTP